MKNKKTIYLLFYFIISLYFMEMIFRALTFQRFSWSSIVVSLLFTTAIGIFLYFLCSLVTGKIRFILSIILLFGFSLLFSSQLIYYDFFRTIYSFYSATNALQVFEFWEDIWMLTVKNAIWIILFILPVVLFLILGNKFISFKRIKGWNKVMIAGAFLMAQLSSIGVVYMAGKEQNSAYDLYYKSSLPHLSTDRLGLLTTMRIQLQRQLTNWSPKIDLVNPYLPVNAEPKEKPNDMNDELNQWIEAEKSMRPIEDKRIQYNTLPIDFDELIATETDETLLEMHRYFQHVPPTNKNEYTGKFKGYNLIFITAEAFSPYAVHKEVTPTLYKLVHEGYQFTNFYNPVWEVSTSDGEYVATTGLLPKSGVWSFSESSKIYLPFVMGNQLKQLGYKTVAYHNHTYTYYDRHLSHPNMGYDYKGVGNGLNITQTWPESDLEMMEVTIPEFIDKEPFHAYYMTVSGHMQYSFDGNMMAWRNKDAVSHLPYSEQAKAYIATQVELDKALEHLLNELEEAGVLDHTLIVLSADHYPYGLEKETIDELAGHPVEENFELYKSPLIIYATNIEPTIIEEPCSSLDIIPTLSNLLGLEYDSRLLMGVDIFSDAEPLVIFLNRSFITDKGRFNGITQQFIPNEGADVKKDYLDQMKGIVTSKFYYSAKILETDYYSKVLEKVN
jgi:lipoteichoic acid synthase